MASRDVMRSAASYDATDIARLENGSRLPARAGAKASSVRRRLSIRQTNKALFADRRATRARVIACMFALLGISYLSLGIMGAMGADYAYSQAYTIYTPVEVAQAIAEHAYNAVAQATHQYSPHANEWILEHVPYYWAVWHRLGVVGITILCGILLSVSGMLYQNVFRNPLAGPGMLGASSGVSLGILLLVILYGASASVMLEERYLYCYGFGAAILAFVLVVGRKLSGRGKPFDIVTMMLVGSIFGQLAGFFHQYFIMFVYTDDAAIQNVFIQLSQMLVVDTSPLSWACLLVAFAVSFIPIWLMRYRMNALAFSDEEVRLFGVNFTGLRAVALLCGAIMLLAAQIHTGTVGMVSMIVPFMSRAWFGTEFSKQLVGNVCIGTLLLIVCRDIADLIPFVGDGFGLGTIVQIVAMPLFIVIMVRHLNTWE